MCFLTLKSVSNSVIETLVKNLSFILDAFIIFILLLILSLIHNPLLVITARYLLSDV